MIYIIMYLVIGLAFGLEQAAKFLNLTGVKPGLLGLVILGLTIWAVAWPIFVGYKVYKKELA